MVNLEVEIARHEEQIYRLSKDLNGHIIDNQEDFKEIRESFRNELKEIRENIDKIYVKLDDIQKNITNRLPSWVAFLFAALTCLLGLLGGQALK